MKEQEYEKDFNELIKLQDEIEKTFCEVYEKYNENENKYYRFLDYLDEKYKPGEAMSEDDYKYNIYIKNIRELLELTVGALHKAQLNMEDCALIAYENLPINKNEKERF